MKKYLVLSLHELSDRSFSVIELIAMIVAANLINDYFWVPAEFQIVWYAIVVFFAFLIVLTGIGLTLAARRWLKSLGPESTDAAQ